MLKGKVAIITGGSKGLGKAILEKFLENDCKVVFTYLTSEEEAQKLADQYGNNVLPIKADASDYTMAKKVIDITINNFGKIDILINNVGLAKDKPIWLMDEERWDFGIANTLKPCFNYTRAVVNYFIQQKSGKIINIGSINGIRGREGSVSYCSAKSGIIGFTKTVAKELGEYNINVNVVAPGYIDTNGQENTSELIKKMVLNECAIRKLTKPNEIAELVEFLASDKSNNITGQVIKIDCGQYI